MSRNVSLPLNSFSWLKCKYRNNFLTERSLKFPLSILPLIPSYPHSVSLLLFCCFKDSLHHNSQLTLVKTLIPVIFTPTEFCAVTLSHNIYLIIKHIFSGIYLCFSISRTFETCWVIAWSPILPLRRHSGSFSFVPCSPFSVNKVFPKDNTAHYLCYRYFTQA